MKIGPFDHRRYHGAAVIFERFLSPFFLEYEHEIDEKLRAAHVEAKKHVWTFSLYLITEGSKVTGEKALAAVSLLMRLSGLSSTGNDESVLSSAEMLGNAIDAGLQKRALGARATTTQGCEEESPPLAVEDGGEDEGEEEVEVVVEEVVEDSMTPEEQELLADFLDIMNEGVYLNVSTETSVPHLRIVTLSSDRQRLLWSNLRDLRHAERNASSLHLCTASQCSSSEEDGLFVALSCGSDPVVTFEAQDADVHGVLRVGMRLLLLDAHGRARDLLRPVLSRSRPRQLHAAFRAIAASAR